MLSIAVPASYVAPPVAAPPSVTASTKSRNIIDKVARAMAYPHRTTKRVFSRKKKEYCGLHHRLSGLRALVNLGVSVVRQGCAFLEAELPIRL